MHVERLLFSNVFCSLITDNSANTQLNTLLCQEHISIFTNDTHRSKLGEKTDHFKDW